MSGLRPIGSGVKAPDSSRVHAFQLLRMRGIRVAEVVHVSPWAITFTRLDGSVATAWVKYDAEKKQCLISTENGLPAFPS